MGVDLDKPLVELIPYRKIVWVNNYAKTVTTSSLISTGVGLFATGWITRLENNGWSEASMIIGFILFILALIITFFIDLWVEKHEKRKLEITDAKIEAEREKMRIELKEESIRLAKSMVENELYNIDETDFGRE